MGRREQKQKEYEALRLRRSGGKDGGSGGEWPDVAFKEDALCYYCSSVAARCIMYHVPHTSAITAITFSSVRMRVSCDMDIFRLPLAVDPNPALAPDQLARGACRLLPRPEGKLRVQHSSSGRALKVFSD